MATGSFMPTDHQRCSESQPSSTNSLLVGMLEKINRPTLPSFLKGTHCVTLSNYSYHLFKKLQYN